MPSDPALTDTTNRDLVVVRILGNVSVRLPTSIFVAAELAWAQGVMPVTVQAFSAGAVPLPQIDQPGWLYQQAGFMKLPALVNGGVFERTIDLDVKGQRRVPKSGNVLFHILRNIGAVDLEFQLHLRVLFRLP